MLIRLGYDISFITAAPTPFVAMLSVHPSRRRDLQGDDRVSLEPATVALDEYLDVYGNVCTRFTAPAGTVRLTNCTTIADSGQVDAVDLDAPETPIADLPADVMPYLMASRYCETDLLSAVAGELFGGVPAGWGRVQAICDWVHSRVRFSYPEARPTRTALDVFGERVGVCRDFQHLAVAFCRAMNIPARYATGYLGDIGVPAAPSPMDFSAWFEAYLGGRWWTFDARHNTRRIGRVLIAVGRDATDVAITTSFGRATLSGFTVVTEAIDAGA